MQIVPKGDLVLAKVAEVEEKTTGGILLPTSAQKRPTSGVHRASAQLECLSTSRRAIQTAALLWLTTQQLEGPAGGQIKGAESQALLACAVAGQTHHIHLAPPPLLAGDVVALGDGQVGSKEHDFQLRVGDTILYSKFGLGVTEVELQDSEHILLREDDVIGVLPRSNATAGDIPELQPVGDRVLIKVRRGKGWGYWEGGIGGGGLEIALVTDRAQAWTVCAGVA